MLYCGGILCLLPLRKVPLTTVECQASLNRAWHSQNLSDIKLGKTLPEVIIGLQMLVLAGFKESQGEITPSNYTMPDGTKVTFGNVSTFIDSGINDVTDLQVDQYIPGNLLAVDFSTLRTVNSSGATIVVGDGTFTGYVNGYGTGARVSYPAVYQLTPEILLLAEYFNHCVRLLNRTDNNYVTDFVGSCTSAGYVDGFGTAARLQYPTRLLGHPVDLNLVFVSEDLSGNIRLINVTSKSVTTYLRSAFISLTSIVWDPYYCNTLLITDYYSFKRLQIDTFTLTTYGNASGYVDGSLHLAQFQYLWDAKALYKDLYAVVDFADHRVRIIDTASCAAFSACSGVNTTTDGPLDQCTVYRPSSLLFTSGVLYIGGNGYINALTVSVDTSQSSATTTPASSCAPISTESTRNGSTFIDEASCQQPPSTTTSTSTTSTTTTTTTPSTTTTTPATTTTATTTTPTTTATTTTPTTTAITTTPTTTATTTTPTTTATTTTPTTTATTTAPTTTATTPATTTTATTPTSTTTATAPTSTTTATTTTPTTTATTTTPITFTTTPTLTTTVALVASTTPTASTSNLSPPPTTSTTINAMSSAPGQQSSGFLTTTTPSGTNGTSSVSSSNGLQTTSEFNCAVGTPSEFTSKSCPEGCFGLYQNGVSNIGCMEDLKLSDNGFGSTSTCGTDEMEGQCEFFVSEDGEVERCIRCCTSGDNCNTVYKERCDYVPTDDKCSSCASRVSDVFVLWMGVVILLFRP